MKKFFRIVLFVLCGIACQQTATAVEAQTPVECFADAVLAARGSAEWIAVEGGELSAALRARAKAQEIPVNIIPLTNATVSDLDALYSATESFPSKVRVALYSGCAPFLVKWAVCEPDEVCAKVRLLSNPSILGMARLVAVPEGFLYRPAKKTPDSADELKSLVDKGERARGEVGEILMRFPHASSESLDAVRHACGVLQNNLGCLLYKAGCTNEAFNAFLSSDTVWRDGLSSLLNMASLIREGVRQDQLSRIGTRLNELSEANKSGGWMMAKRGGYILHPEMFFQAGWYWTMSGLSYNDTDGFSAAMDSISDESVRAQVRGNMQLGIKDQLAGAELPLRVIAAMDSETDLTLDSAVPLVSVLLSAKSMDQARWVVRKVCTRSGQSEYATALAQAEFFGRVREPQEAARVLTPFLKGETLPASLEVSAGAWLEREEFDKFYTIMQQLSRTKDPVRSSSANFILSGLDARKSNDADLVEELFQKAVEANSTSWIPKRLLLLTLLSSGDNVRTLAAAESLLAVKPYDSLGNYVKARCISDRGDLEASLEYYQRSIVENPSVMALNDFAETLTKLGQYKKAIEHAWLAVRATDFKNGATLDTLGWAQFKAGSLEFARNALKDADSAFEGRSSITRLRLAAVHAALGENDEARKLLKSVESEASTFDSDEKILYNELKSKIK